MHVDKDLQILLLCPSKPKNLRICTSSFMAKNMQMLPMQGCKEGSRNRRLLLSALELFKLGAEALGTKLFRSKEQSDRLLHLVWIQFATSYTSQKLDSTTEVCTAYLQVHLPHLVVFIVACPIDNRQSRDMALCF